MPCGFDLLALFLAADRAGADFFTAGRTGGRFGDLPFTVAVFAGCGDFSRLAFMPAYGTDLPLGTVLTAGGF